MIACLSGVAIVHSWFLVNTEAVFHRWARNFLIRKGISIIITITFVTRPELLCCKGASLKLIAVSLKLIAVIIGEHNRIYLQLPRVDYSRSKSSGGVCLQSTPHALNSRHFFSFRINYTCDD